MPMTAKRSRRDIRLWAFIAGFSIYTMIAFQRPLLAYALPNLDFGSPQGLVELASLQVIQFGLMFIFLTLLSVLPTILMKVFCIATLFANAAGAYFMTSYNIELDRTMIGNILSTDQREASQLWHPHLMVQAVLFALLPSLLILWLRVRKPRWYVRLGAAAMAVVMLIGWVYATSFTWLWFDEHIPRIGGRVLPWSYIVNTVRYFNQDALANREQTLLPDANFLAAVPPGQKDIVVLVIGEASRAQNYAYYGYQRDTNPYTRDLGVVVLPAGQSCATYTIGSLACILTHEGSAASPRTGFEPLPSYLTRMGIETIFRANNTGEPPVKVTHYERTSEIMARCHDSNCPDPAYDEALVWGLADDLKASQAQRIFVVLHQAGSHGPSYWKKYPPAFEKFTPICATVEVESCSRQALVNTYDNTIRYTDYVNALLIKSLKTIPSARIAMIYVSDHGQSLGEHGLFLHGTPNAIAPAEQRMVPFLVWMNDAFMAAHGLTQASIQRPETQPHDLPFHSVLGAFGMASPIYKPEDDIFAK
jgi:lipid A ethanolaminephosphotransferase